VYRFFLFGMINACFSYVFGVYLGRMVYIMKLIRVLALLSLLSAPFYSNAGVILQVSEVNSDVVFSYSGTINLASTLGKDVDRNASWNRYDSTSSYFGFRALIDTSADDYNLAFTSSPAFGLMGNTSFGAGGILSGDGFFVDYSIYNSQIWLGDGYVSGSSILGSMKFSNTDFAQMGLVSGDYEWTWAQSGVSDFLTMNVLGATADVPEPSIIVLFAAGLFGLGFALKRTS
jgi:hypothetical protein